MENIYNPKKIEHIQYANWELQQHFTPNNNWLKENYCIMVPPPNITGNLHLGHAFQHTIIDILIRYHKMQGKNTLCQYGTDHAGIATQIIVEQHIKNNTNKSKHEYGKKKFIQEIWKWKEKNENIMNHQIRKLGTSIYWDNQRFTMDNKISYAVQEAFIKLYKDKLIYKGKKIVNWDPILQTVISDLEVENKETTNFIWYIRYPLIDQTDKKNNLNYLIISTTRPETILGDVAIAINPLDTRYNHLIGKHVKIPIINYNIPIIADHNVNIKQGTGCVKITPGHDFNDYLLGKKHNLPIINIFTYNGYIKKKPEILDNYGNINNNISRHIPCNISGLERFAARKKIIEEIKKLNLLHDVKSHKLILPYSERSGAIIEPMLTNQWYLNTKPLAKNAIDVIKNGKIKFIPKQYENIYFNWMNNIQDWCISRQIWWGHSIPIWYSNQGKIYIGRNEKEIRSTNKLDDNIQLIQEQDVLDTWFSSSIWTFATLGWPKNTNLLKKFHPTNVIVSGFDIIFFWIARMIMLTMHLVKDKHGNPQIPFKTIYITGLIRDELGQKMSKSLGNTIDPIDIIDGISIEELIIKRTKNMLKPKLSEKIKKITTKNFPQGINQYGADALRFTLAALSSNGRDIIWDTNRLTGYRNFCNKIWHASRFILINIDNISNQTNKNIQHLSLINKWIFIKFNQTVKLFKESLDNYRFDCAANILYEFIWNQFCNWYIEFSKITIIQKSLQESQDTKYTLITILKLILRLAHPIIPFITENIWHKIQIVTKMSCNDSIIMQPFPIFNPNITDNSILYNVKWLKTIIIKLRNIRTQLHIPPKQLFDISLITESIEIKELITNNLQLLYKIAKINKITITSKKTTNIPSFSILLQNAEILIPMNNTLNDTQIEISRIKKELNNIEHQIMYLTKKLNNKDFITHAPETIVIKNQKQLQTHIQNQNKLIKQINNINKKIKI